MNTPFQDLRYGLRSLRRNPGFTAITVATLGLGIGATTVIFSFVNAVVLRPLSYRDSHRLAMVLTEGQGSGPVSSVMPGDFLDWQAQSHAFEEMAAFSSAGYSLTGEGEPERLLAANVTSRFFNTLAATPLVGRTFLPREGRPGADRVVVISAALWHRRFQSDRAIAGRSIVLDGKAFTVAGVMPDGFAFPEEIMFPPNEISAPHLSRAVDVWVPVALPPGERGNTFINGVVARLRSNVTLDQAQAEMTAVADRLAERFPGNRGMGIKVLPLHQWVVRDVKPLLFVFLGAVGFLLLIACTNVANLLLARAAARQKEVAIRTALGSSRWRLIQQFLTESVLLGLLGGSTGLLLAMWGVDLVSHFIPAGSVPRLHEVDVDGQVMAFTMFLSFLTSVIFGLAPALHASNLDRSSARCQGSGPNVVTALKDADTTQSRASRVLNAYVVSEVTLAFVLLAGAGLLLKSFVRLTGIDPGFKPANILAVTVTLPDVPYATSAQMGAFTTEVLERLRAVPAVLHAGAVNWLPFGGSLLWGDFTVEGLERLPQGLSASKPAVSPDYFGAIGIPLLRGRAFTSQDASYAPGVAIVTDQLARRVWPGHDPIGKRLKLGFGRPEEEPWLSVVGVAANVKQRSLGERPSPTIYVPLVQAPSPFLLRSQTFVVRATSDPLSLAADVRREIHAVDPLLPAERIATMEQLIGDSVAEPRFRSVLLGSFAGTAIALVATGILGVLAYSVSRRTREIGLRMALGARHLDLVRAVVRHALLLTAAGIALGLLGAVMLTRFLTSFLFEVRPLDPATLVASTIVMIVVAVVASYVPARRAASVDPLEALRTE
jgi:putative ABC transport system permease protein